MHLLLFLHTEDRFLDQEHIDQVMCAELPDPAMNPDSTLTEIVKSQLTHSPCKEHDPRAPCMVDTSDSSGQVCFKWFLKPFQAETSVQEDGYPLYQQCQDGQTWVKRVCRIDVVIDNF